MTPFGELVGTHSIWRQLVLRMRNVTSCTLPGVPCAVRCVTASVSSPYPLLSLVRVRACICTSYVVYACRSKISNPFVSTSITDTKLSTLDPLTRYTMRYSCAIQWNQWPSSVTLRLWIWRWRSRTIMTPLGGSGVDHVTKIVESVVFSILNSVGWRGTARIR